MRTIWKGSISFGLVNIPIELYPAIQEHSLGFKLLHNECLTPISYKRWCSHCNREIPMQEIVKGFKLPDGTYYILDKETLETLKPVKSDSIDIVEFVDADQIKSLYLDKHYYILPQKKTNKAFFLFMQALLNLKKLAIGQFVLRDKQYICAIEPYLKGLLLSTLNYVYEIRDLPALSTLEVPKVNQTELKLAEELINTLYNPKFDLGKYKDTFATKLKERIRKSAKGIRIPQKEVIHKVEEPSLIEALKASLKTNHGAYKH